MDAQRQEILQFYEEMRGRVPLEVEMVQTPREFVSLLFSKRELSGSYFSTSHGTLCISRFATHEQQAGKPLMTVHPLGMNMIVLSLRIDVFSEDASQSRVGRSIIHKNQVFG